MAQGSTDSPGTPDWLRESAPGQQLRSFWSVNFLFCTQPRRFIDEWAEGKRELPNPLHFTAASLALFIPLYFWSLSAIFGAPAPSTAWGALLRTLVVQLTWPVASLICHPVLLPARPLRSFRATWGALLLLQAGPMTLAGALGCLYAVVAHRLGVELVLVRMGPSASQSVLQFAAVPLAMLWPGCATLLALVVPTLRGAQRVRTLWAVLASAALLLTVPLVSTLLVRALKLLLLLANPA